MSCSCHYFEVLVKCWLGRKKKRYLGNREILYKPEFENKKIRIFRKFLKDLMTEILSKCGKMGKDGVGDYFMKALHTKK